MRLFQRKSTPLPTGDSLSRAAWRRMKKNRLAASAMLFILFLILIAAGGYLFTPDKTPWVNTQYLELNTRKPGFTTRMLQVTNNRKAPASSWLHTIMYGQPSATTSIPCTSYTLHDQFITLALVGDPGDTLTQYQTFSLADVAYAINPDYTPQRKGTDSLCFQRFNGQMITLSLNTLTQQITENNLHQHTFWLGTDRFGRDVLSQIMLGSRVSLAVGFIAVFISLIIGITLGAIAGFFRGWIDDIIIWFINVVWSIPTLLMVIAITFALGKGFWQVFVAVGLTMWVEVARVVRGQIMGIREKEYVEAGVALGFKPSRIIIKHILPNALGPVIVISAANFASAILLEAGLSFLGIGVQPPMPSWGTMIKENYGYIILDSAYLALLPGLAIMLTVLAFMLIGNGLREAMDIKQQKK